IRRACKTHRRLIVKPEARLASLRSRPKQTANTDDTFLAVPPFHGGVDLVFALGPAVLRDERAAGRRWPAHPRRNRQRRSRRRAEPRAWHRSSRARPVWRLACGRVARRSRYFLQPEATCRRHPRASAT